MYNTSIEQIREIKIKYIAPFKDSQINLFPNASNKVYYDFLYHHQNQDLNFINKSNM